MREEKNKSFTDSLKRFEEGTRRTAIALGISVLALTAIAAPHHETYGHENLSPVMVKMEAQQEMTAGFGNLNVSITPERDMIAISYSTDTGTAHTEIRADGAEMPGLDEIATYMESADGTPDYDYETLHLEYAGEIAANRGSIEEFIETSAPEFASKTREFLDECELEAGDRALSGMEGRTISEAEKVSIGQVIDHSLSLGNDPFLKSFEPEAAEAYMLAAEALKQVADRGIVEQGSVREEAERAMLEAGVPDHTVKSIANELGHETKLREQALEKG